MTKVSVIIPVYGVERYLPECLDSVLSQTLTELEVIAVDDASPDRCGVLLDEYAARDPRVRVIHLKENRRQGYGRNLGIDRAEGEYLYFLDSDDAVTPDALRALYALARGDALDAVFFDSQVRFESEALAKKHAYYPAARKGTYEDRVYAGPELFDAFMDQGEWTCYPQRQLWRRDFVRESGMRFLEGAKHEDEIFPHEGLLKAKRVRYSPARYFIRRYREGSDMTVPVSAQDFHGYFRTYCAMLALMEDRQPLCRAEEMNLARMYNKMTRMLPLFEGEDLDAWAFAPGEREAYRFFLYGQRAGMQYEALCRPFIEEARRKKRLFLYGAGVLARDLWRGLTGEAYGLAVEGFLVTKHEGNPRTLFGRRVQTLDEAQLQEGDCVIIAVSRGYRQEIAQALDERGVEWIAGA